MSTPVHATVIVWRRNAGKSGAMRWHTRCDCGLSLKEISVEGSQATEKPVVTFDERTSRSPEVIRSVFHPGETTGMALVYPSGLE